MNPSGGVAAILPAAGKGRRFGAPKQFLDLQGEPLLLHVARRVASTSVVDALIVVAPPGEEGEVEAMLRGAGVPKLHAVVPGGAERSDSVRRGLEACPPEASFALVHDAARPFASAALFERVVEAARDKGAAIAALPCTDTVKQSDDGVAAARTLDRSKLWLAQTPQVFRIDWLRAAYEAQGPAASQATDEAALLEAAGHEVQLVPGERENFKVTEPEDGPRAQRQFGPATRVGFGYDVHAFEEGRRLFLGGVEFPGEVGLRGHSDADVVLHAVMDALLGAAGLGDIGLLFPDTDDRYRGANSQLLLQEVLTRVREVGLRVGNVDLTILAERPKIGPRREELRERIAGLLEVPTGRVNVKASTSEGLGFVGRREGIACQAVVLLHG